MSTETAALVHDINNQLTIALGVISNLETKVDLPDNIKKAMATVTKALKQTVEYCSDAVKDTVEPLEVGEVLKKITKREGIDTYILDNKKMVLSSGRAKLKRMFDNLLKNSIEAKATKAKITINEKNIIYVDNGEGFSVEALRKIRKNEKTSSKGIYRGIGLESIRELSSKMGLKVKFENGSIFSSTDMHGVKITFIIIEN